MSETEAHLVNHVITHLPIRQRVLSLPIPLHVLLAAQLELLTPVLQVVQCVVTRHLRGQAGLATDDGHGGCATLSQRIGSTANLSRHLHCLVMDGDGTGGGPALVETNAPIEDEPRALLRTVISG